MRTHAAIADMLERLMSRSAGAENMHLRERDNVRA
jgi:hypothetical protein